MALGVIDRVLTVVVTATLTSAAWIVAGSGFLRSGGKEGLRQPREAAAVPSAASTAPTALASPTPEDPDTPLLIPVSGVSVAQLSDTFSDARGGERAHEALDIMAPAGTPVIAAAAGEVEKLFLSAAGGKTIYLRSPDRRTIHYYAHLDAYAPGLREGQQIRRGERLGAVGSTGNADPTAPHLHFAILRTTPEAQWWEPATALNPYPLLKRGN